MVNAKKILATNEKNNSIFWGNNVTLYEDYLKELSLIWRTNSAESWLFNLKWAIKIFVKSREFDVVITNADKASLLFSLLQLLFRKNRKPHYILFVLWNLPDKGIRKFIKMCLYKLILKSVSKIIVFSKKQQSLHAQAFNVPLNSFPVVPYHTTMREIELEIYEGDYLFSGGDTGRDYRTLIEAMRGLPYKLVIAALYRNHFDGIDIPQNVYIVKLTADEFLVKMAGCRAMVLPLFGHKLQAGGQQTFLNAMLMGKTVIIADDNSASEYITDGVDGFIVKPESVEDLRMAICNVMNDVTMCKLIGTNAKKTASRFTSDKFAEQVVNLVIADIDVCD